MIVIARGVGRGKLRALAESVQSICPTGRLGLPKVAEDRHLGVVVMPSPGVSFSFFTLAQFFA